MTKDEPLRTETLGALILAAGASTRMGTPKMLLPWSANTVIGHLFETWRVLAAQVVVVIAANDSGVERELLRVGAARNDITLNSYPSEGMFGSIRSASLWSGWNPDVDRVAIVLGDQPQLPVDTVLRPLITFSAQNRGIISQPGYAGRARHPVIVPREPFLTLRLMPKGATLRDFLAAQHVAIRDLDCPALAVDLDTPGDYEAARRKFGA